MQAWRQSVSSPGQKYRSRKCSLRMSALKCPFALWVSRASWNPEDVGIHSVFGTLSRVFKLTRHSLSFSIMNPSALCTALRLSVIELPVDFPSKWFTIGVKNMSPLNAVSNGCFDEGGESSAIIISFGIPL